MAGIKKIENWAEIRRLAEQGVPFATLAKNFKICAGTIYAKSATEQWLTPARLKLKMHKLNSEAHLEHLKSGKLTEKGDSVLLESWQTRAADIRQLAWEVSRQAIAESRGSIVLETASDLKAAVHVARQATGLLDTEAPAVQLSIFGGSGSLLEDGADYDGYIEDAFPSPEIMDSPEEPDYL